MKIGIDLDNTLIHYDAAFVGAAAARGLLPGNFAGGKQELRDALRAKGDEGEIAWQQLQGHVYGKGIGAAKLFAGADRFLQDCRSRGKEVVIVSHKTEFGHYDPDRVNLRDAARGWMRAQGFFRPDGFGLSEANVHFEATRKAKVERIAALNCDAFIDDLFEVFEEPDFPKGVRQILFSAPQLAPQGHWEVCASWDDIRRAVFG